MSIIERIESTQVEPAGSDPVSPQPHHPQGTPEPTAGDTKARASLAWRAIDALLGVYYLRRLVSVILLVSIDVVALFGGFGLAEYLVGENFNVWRALHEAPMLLTVWLAIFAAHRLYDRASERRNPLAMLRAIVLASLVALVGSQIYPDLGLNAREVLLGTLAVVVFMCGMRLLYERGTKLVHLKKLGLRPTLLVGEDEMRQRVRRSSEQTPGSYTLVGELPLSGNGVDLHALRQELDRTGARQVIVAGAQRFSEKNFMAFMRSCRLRRVDVNVVPSAAALMGGRITFAEEVGVPLLHVEYPTLDNYQRVLKRALDFFGAFFGLLALSPLLLTVAAAIKLSSPGPVLFTQKRVGADEKTFLCYKFRSMYRDAERRQAELEALNEVEGAVFKIKNDPRITPIGHFIRRFSIDELPQLLNVLKGEMSLVGPRPLPVRDFELMSEAHKRRLGAMPGMTGYWQISGRSDLSFEEMVSLDLYYIENWSLSFDVKIIARTLGAVLRHEGAY